MLCRRCFAFGLDPEERGNMKTDSELQRSVMEELVWEPSVDAAEFGVAAESGIVTLSGTGNIFPEKWAAEKAAQRVSGVKAITDELVVKLPGDSEVGDTEIARAVVNALDWNASVPKRATEGCCGPWMDHARGHRAVSLRESGGRVRRAGNHRRPAAANLSASHHHKHHPKT